MAETSVAKNYEGRDVKDDAAGDNVQGDMNGRNQKHFLPESDAISCGSAVDLEVPLSPLLLSNVDACIGSPGSLYNSFNGNPGSVNNNTSETAGNLNHSYNGRTSALCDDLNENLSGNQVRLNNSFNGSSVRLNSSLNHGDSARLSYSYNGNFNSLGSGSNGNLLGEGQRERSESNRIKKTVEDRKPLLDDTSSCSFDLESTQMTTQAESNVTCNNKSEALESRPESNTQNTTEVHKEQDLHVTELDAIATERKEEEQCNVKVKVASRPDSGNNVDSLAPGELIKKDTADGTPRESARSPRPSFRGRLHGYLEPIMPGYTAPIQSSLVIRKTVEVQQEVSDRDTNLRDAIPIMPRPVAVSCFLLNVIIPGAGTLVSGLSVLCCSRPQKKEDSKSSTIWTNCVVALLQLLTVFLFLLGWVWSILWGTTFIQFSQEYNRIEDDSPRSSSRRPSEATPGPSTRTNNRVTTRTTTTTSISLPGASDSDIDTQHPIIVLQEAPVILQAEGEDDITDLVRPHRTLNPYNPRHQRILRRQRSEDDIRPILMNPHAIENIVLNNVPVPHHLGGGRLPAKY